MEYLSLIFFVIFIISTFSFFSLAPWVPTKKSDLERINKIINLQPWEKFLEMWSWTSLVSIYLAKNNPESTIHAIELSPLLYLLSRIKIFFSNTKNIKIFYWNALKKDFTEYNVLYCFWLPETVTNKIFPRIKNLKNNNFRFISYCFKMNNDLLLEQKFKEEWKYSIYHYSL